MSTLNHLPAEIIIKIFESLNIGDLIIASSVCCNWNDIASTVLAERVAIVIEDDFLTAVDTLSKHEPIYKHWILKNVDLNMRTAFENFLILCRHFQSLALLDVEISEKDFLILLQNCHKLKELSLAGLAHIFMSGKILENESAIEGLQDSLKFVKCLRLSCTRYLTDSIFSRISSLVNSLEELSLNDCQICYQNSIWKRFYPSDGHIVSSEHVLTFNFILNFIEESKLTLKSLDLSRTGIDSDSLIKLSKIPELRLETLLLKSCDQLTKLGMQILTQNQTHLMELDISSCARVTDYSVIAIAENLPNLKVLNIAGCHSISEVGIEHLVRLLHLEKLNISHLDVKNWESIHEALGKISRPSLKHLNIASLPVQGETVASFADIMPNLEYLDLSMCIMGVTDRSIQAICKKLIQLKHLFVSGCIGLSDIGLSGHGSGTSQMMLPNIGGNELSLESLGITNRNPYKVPLGMKAEQMIRKEAEVKKYLEQNIDIIVQSSEFGLSHLTKLKQLNLCGCLRVTDLTLTYAVRFKQLWLLDLAHCQQITDEGLLQMAVNCPSLEELHLTDCANISDQAILVISHKLKRIKTLDLQRCIRLTNDALDSLSSCRMLRYLDVSGCKKMTLEGVYDLQNRIPRLVNFHHRSIKNSKDGELLDEFSDMIKAPTPPPLLSKLLKKLSR